MSARAAQVSAAKYDSRHDALHVYFGPTESAWDDEEHPGVVIRRAMSDERIVGVIVLDYSRRREFAKAVLRFIDWGAVESAIAML